MPDLSIEYAHIYTSHEIGEEHKRSVELLKDATKSIDRKSYSLVVMVDDYSFPDPTFDYKVFIEWLSDRGFKPDIVIRESQLIPICDEVLSLVRDDKLRNNIVNYIKTKNKYPCSLFIASWYLLRLGVIRSVIYDNHFIAKKLLNILPLSFKPFEDQGMEIIAAVDKKLTESVMYEFTDGRMLI